MLKTIEMDTRNPAQVRQFLRLPFRIYADIPQWVPKLVQEARQVFDRQRFPYYSHSDAAFFLVYDSSQPQPLGSIAVLEPRLFNDYNHTQTAFFYLFECFDHPPAAQALFEAAFDWARRRGLTEIYGPKGFTALDGAGMLARGFEHRPALGIPYNPSYYLKFMQTAGFETESETLSGYLSTGLQFPERIHRASELLQKRRALKILNFRTREELRQIVPSLKDLYNGSLGGTSQTAPITDEEVKVLADQIIWFADPRLMKLILHKDEPVGFLMAYPDISAALQRSQGRLLPFGWVDILLELRRTKWININGAGIKEEYRGLGGPAILFSEMYKSVSETGYQHADLVQISADNDKMQRELRDLGIDFYKMHRIYCRAL